MNFKFSSYLVGLFLFLFPFVTYAADNVDYAARVDCDSGNDTTATIVAGTSSSYPYLTLKKAIEETVKLNSSNTNSRFWIKIKDGCSFATDSITRITFNISSYGGNKGNMFFVQPESTSGLFLIDVGEAGFLEITTAGSFFQIKNAIFQNGKNGMIISQDGNSNGGLVITDSKFDVTNQIMWNPSGDPGNGNFEIKNSLIEINKKFGRSIFRFPSYFHDNIVNYRSLKNSNGDNITTDWLFGGFQNTMKTNKNMGIINNKINIYLDLRKDNFNGIVGQNTNFLTWISRTDNKKFLIMNNEIKFLGTGDSYIVDFSSRGDYTNNNFMFVNNLFFGLTEINKLRTTAACNGYRDSFYRTEVIFFINNTFYATISNYDTSYGNRYNGRYSCTNNLQTMGFNNLNSFGTQTPLGRNFTEGTTEKGLRFAVDLNYDGNIESSEILSNSYCSPKPSCQNSNAPLMIIY